MSYRSRVYRQRNPHSQEEPKQEKTASKTKDATKANSPVQKKLAIKKPGDKYEKEADAAASKASEQHAEGAVVQQKEISSIQRAAAPGEEEKVSTAEGRMEKDKKIQEMPLQRAGNEKEKDKAIQKKDEPKKEEDKAIRKKEEPKKEDEISKPNK